jgi:hypothetical protein
MRRLGAALAQTEQLEDAVLLAGQAHRFVADRDDAIIEIDASLPVRIVDSEWPLERRTIAWIHPYRGS